VGLYAAGKTSFRGTVFLRTFSFIDQILEVRKEESLTALYTLKGNEEFLKDHFAGFPVMPGVLMVEALKQAASSLLALSGGVEAPFHRLKEARDIRFGQFVKPGMDLKVFVRWLKKEEGADFFEGRIERVGRTSLPAQKVLSAQISLLPVKKSVSARLL